MSANQCPACDASQIETIDGVPSPTCCCCGLVISEDVDVPSIPETESESTLEPRQWSEFYTITNATEKQTAEGLESLYQLSTQLELSATAVSQAAEIFSSAIIQELTDGRSYKLITAAAVCIAAREGGEPRPVGVIGKFAGIESDPLSRAVRLLQQSLDRGFAENEPAEYLPHLCTELELPEQTRTRSVDFAQTYAEKVRLAGKDPVGIAGAALYQAAAGRITQREIAETAGITQETIRVRLNELRQILEETNG
jgi:transcription initiation factor TFIIB